MAIIKSFRALRPSATHAKQVSCVPYDVVYESEVRAFITSNSLSFLRVTRAEAEFPEDSKPPAADVFARAKQNLEWFISEKIYTADPEDAFYVYQLASDEHAQTGVVGCCSIDEYEQGVIKKHENVRPDKVEDRTGHLLAVSAQTGLIFLGFRNTETIRTLLADAVKQEPIYNFECPDGIRQKIWRLTDPEPWKKAFSEVPALYIADGHHRAESAKLARDKMREQNNSHTGAEDYNFVVAGMFPAEDLKILPYNRVIKDLNGLTEDEFFVRIQENFILSESDEKVPQNHGEFCMYMDGKWYKLLFSVNYVREPDPIERLDVSILQTYLLEPHLGIDDARTNNRIGFVGGARGTAELERIVDESIAKVAFSMFATTMDDLFAVSDMGEIMPPKSTWFEPKLKDGLLVHMI
ncbi:MAG: DUF1015 domain-containing protein [Pyrinomonadaceae bacterium]